ncbi:MAG: hypothetical protein ABSH36_05500 [Solirubrobacteraceae bacterium]|jgi:hypothetical protein
MATFVRDPEPVELQELREYRERHDLDHKKRQVHLFALRDGEKYEPVERSALIELGPAGLAEQLDWP